MEVSPIQVHSHLTAEVGFIFTFYNTIIVNGRVKLLCNMKIIDVVSSCGKFPYRLLLLPSLLLN